MPFFAKIWSASQPCTTARSTAFDTPPATDIRTELKRLSPTVLAFLQREAPGQSNFSVSNFGLVEGPRSLLAIDAGGGPQHARNFLRAAQTLGKLRPVTAAAGGLISSLLKDGLVSDDPGVDNTWRIVSLVICGLVIVVGLGALLYQWRRGQEEP